MFVFFQYFLDPAKRSKVNLKRTEIETVNFKGLLEPLWINHRPLNWLNRAERLYADDSRFYVMMLELLNKPHVLRTHSGLIQFILNRVAPGVLQLSSSLKCVGNKHVTVAEFSKSLVHT